MAISILISWCSFAGRLPRMGNRTKNLPGVIRATLLGSNRLAREEPFDLERMASAERIFLTSSIRGRHPARIPHRDVLEP